MWLVVGYSMLSRTLWVDDDLISTMGNNNMDKSVGDANDFSLIKIKQRISKVLV
jgi:hypothetical protein